MGVAFLKIGEYINSANLDDLVVSVFFWILEVVVLAVVTQTTSLRKPGEDRGPLGLGQVRCTES